MGWGSAGYSIFDPMARSLIESGASDELKRKTLGPLIDRLRSEDWDTCEDSLQNFSGDPVIVALFRERDITIDCRDQGGLRADVCTRNLGHDGDHVDEQDNSWPQARSS